ncbi:ferredoxin [Sphingobium sp. 15-1]|uniref:ferredoxin n=1 Tax=Sphingobium sp. 15-1 TaxID=2729616 RepID=UPI00159C340B|nr:ferredoxin [Sphingobium sp. 15-1]
MKIHIRQDLCVGAGLCVLSSAQVFDQREEDGVVVLLQDNPPPELYDAVRGAARKCPSLAIIVEEDEPTGAAAA